MEYVYSSTHIFFKCSFYIKVGLTLFDILFNDFYYIQYIYNINKWGFIDKLAGYRFRRDKYHNNFIDIIFIFNLIFMMFTRVLKGLILQYDNLPLPKVPYLLTW